MTAVREGIRRVVVKLGTGILTRSVGEIDRERLAAVAAEVAGLRAEGIVVCLVSSGAVGMGMKCLGFEDRPTALPDLQACAAVGQIQLLNAWREAFGAHELEASQILLTREDVRHRERHLAVRAVLERLFVVGSIIPILNENDSVSTTEIRFGDNDVLSALVASLLRADLLLILSTAPGLIDPASGRVLPVVTRIDETIEAMAGGTTSRTAVGGMLTKLAAARIANQSGCGVFIGDGSVGGLIGRMVAGETVGTFFVPDDTPISSRKRWLAFFHRPTGAVRIDAGAVRAVREDHRSLLAKGITGVEGEFAEGDVVSIEGPDGGAVGRGEVLFASRELREICGMGNAEIAERYPERKRYEVIHRDHLAVL